MNSLLCDDVAPAIEKLLEAFRETVYMVNVKGFSYNEVVEALDISPGKIRSRVNRGAR